LNISALERLSGWIIGQRLKQVSCDILQVSDGSICPALHKLVREGWILQNWKPRRDYHRAKFLFVNAALTQEVEKEADLNRLSSAISRVVKLKEF
jgi:PadR family transcriptional regulator, regulatory protein PadR